MNQRPLTRLVGAIVALTFVAGLGADVYGLHQCPHHDHSGEFGVVPDQGEVAGAVAGTRPAPSADPGDHAVGPPAAPEDGPEPEGPCTCVGACHASASTPVVAVPPVAVPAAGAATRLSFFQPERQLPPNDSPYLLPFANAPPRLS